MWTGTVLLPPGKALEGKLVLMDPSGSASSTGGGRWETGGNRIISVEATPRLLMETAKAAETEAENCVAFVGGAGDLLSPEEEGLAHGWMDPASLADLPFALEAESGDGDGSGGAGEALSTDPPASVDPEVALVLHWGLPSFTQVQPPPLDPSFDPPFPFLPLIIVYSPFLFPTLTPLSFPLRSSQCPLVTLPQQSPSLPPWISPGVILSSLASRQLRVSTSR